MSDAGATLNGERRLPRKCLLIAVACAIGTLAPVAYGLHQGMGALPVSWQVFGGLCFLATLGQLPTLFTYALGPRRLTFGANALACDAATHPYAQMTSIACDAGSEITRIELADGSRLKLRWDIWVNDEEWNALLLERTFAHLHASSTAALERGEKVAFGRGVALDRQTLHLPKGSLPLDAIAEIRIAEEHDSGVRIRTLHVASLDRQLTVEERHLCNSHVLFALLRERLPRPRLA